MVTTDDRRKPRGNPPSHPIVGILVGSETDLPVMEETIALLKRFGIAARITVTSAHRSPERTRRVIREFEREGAEVLIAAAGGAAHLPGVVAAETLLPVIGVPIDSSPLKGMDALLSIVQMPAGVPVAGMAIGKAGAKNAAVLAARILAIKYPGVAAELERYRQELAAEVERKAKALDT